jgi:hypothetical protein
MMNVHGWATVRVAAIFADLFPPRKLLLLKSYRTGPGENVTHRLLAVFGNVL